MNHEAESAPSKAENSGRKLKMGALALVLVVGGTMGALYLRARAATNGIALRSEPKRASFATARKDEYRENRRFVGTVEPWLAAKIGPQILAAYVDTVLVRPGDPVRKGAVLATLDCRSAATGSQAIAAQARALQERQRAMAAEEARLKTLQTNGFVSDSEIEQKSAQTSAGAAALDGVRAQLAGKSLEVNDCLLRAPFDGEIGARFVDPGTFVRPGATLVTVVDRHLLRVVADVPEADAAAVLPRTPVTLRLLAGSAAPFAGVVARGAPSADPATRTIRVEVDVDPAALSGGTSSPPPALPTGTTAEVFVEFGAAEAALVVPLTATKVRNGKASLFVLEPAAADGTRTARARTLRVLGEHAGEVFLAPAELAPGADVVVEGRGRLVDGDRVQATAEPGTKS